MNAKRLLSFVLILVLLVVGTAAAQTDLQSAEASQTMAATSYIPGEPNDTLTTATEVRMDWDYSGYLLSAADVDYYKLAAATAYHVWVDVNLKDDWQSNSPLRIQLALYNANGVLLVEDTDCGYDYGSVASLDRVLPMGIYYLRVRACTGTLDINQGYTLSLYSEPVEQEPNDTRATATPVDPRLLDSGDGEPNDYYYESIDAPGDTDFYSLQAHARQVISVWLTSSFQLSILNSDGSPVTEIPTSCGPGYVCRAYVPPADGTYYLRVRAADHPNGSGNYSLWIRYYDSMGEVEPNDTLPQATIIHYDTCIGGGCFYQEDFIPGGEVHMLEDPADYYRFDGREGDNVLLTNSLFYNSSVDLQLYDPVMNLLATDPTVPVTLPSTGVYFIKVVANNPNCTGTNCWFEYGFLLMLRTGDEPNDTLATATPVQLGEPIYADWYPHRDRDWYRFEGRAGTVIDVNTITNQAGEDFIHLYDANGILLEANALPRDGIYYLEIQHLCHWQDGVCWYYPTTYHLSIGRNLYVSADVNALGGNKSIKQQDVATRDLLTGQWTLVFDASDVGITKDVVALEAMPNGTLLLSLGAAQTVPGLGKVMPQDIIRFVPTSLGANTAGAFQWYLDGSDVGLTTAGEKIDAITLYYSDYSDEPVLIISTSGSASVPRTSGGALKVADEDLIVFDVVQFGQNSQGTWHMEWNGSNVPGVASENLNAVDLIERQSHRPSRWLMTMKDSFVINGIKGGPLDVLFGWDSGPSSLAVQGLTNKPIDALADGPAFTP